MLLAREGILLECDVPFQRKMLFTGKDTSPQHLPKEKMGYFLLEKILTRFPRAALCHGWHQVELCATLSVQ